MGGEPMSGISMPSSIRWARSTRRQSRASTATCGPASNGSCVAHWASPRQSACTISSLGCSSIATNSGAPFDLESTPLRHLPYNKGGPFRKWYGNRDYVINFENDGETMKNDAASGQNKGYRMVSKDWFFRSGITWTDVSSSFLGARLLGTGFTFENTGLMIFPRSAPKEAILGFLCSKISSHLMGMLNPTVHFTVGEIKKLPFCYPGDRFYRGRPHSDSKTQGRLGWS